MQRFWILLFGGWMATADLYGDWFRVVLFREREDVYHFVVEEMGGFTKVTGRVSSSNEKATSVEILGEVTGLCSAGSMITFKINGRAFILTSDRHITIWSKSTDEDNRSNDVFNVCMGEKTPFRKSKEPSFFLDREHVDGRVNFYGTHDSEGESTNMWGFEVLSPYGPNGHPWFSNEPAEQIKFNESAAKLPKQKEPPKNNNFEKDDFGYFRRKK